MNTEIERKECTTCRAIGMIIAAIIVGLITYYLSETQELWVAIVVLLSLLIFGLFFINWFCCRKMSETASKAAPSADPLKTEPTMSEPVVDTEAAVETVPMPEPSIEPEPTPEPIVEADSSSEDFDGDGVEEGENEGTQPEALAGPRDGKADDLKKIKGVGPKLEKVLNELGFFHFDQIANWTTDEIAWVDANLEGFKGRVSRDNWIVQAKTLADGGDTEFSKKVDKGGVY